MKRNIKAVIEFDGSYFKGFQKQTKWAPTVQGVLEQVKTYFSLKPPGCPL